MIEVKHRACDELGYNLYTAGYTWGCALDLPTTEHMIEYISKRRRRNPAGSFEDLLEAALTRESIGDAKERHAYKMALGLFFGNRAQKAKKRNREMNAIPFAPR